MYFQTLFSFEMEKQKGPKRLEVRSTVMRLIRRQTDARKPKLLSLEWVGLCAMNNNKPQRCCSFFISSPPPETGRIYIIYDLTSPIRRQHSLR